MDGSLLFETIYTIRKLKEMGEKMSLFRMVFLILAAFLTMNATAFSSKQISDKRFDIEACIEQNTNDCIEAVCISASPANCKDQCKKDADKKCRELAGQGV